MIRAAIVAVFLTLSALVLGPPFILYTALTRNPDPLYWAGVHCLAFLMRAVGMQVRVEGRENIPAGACLFVANHTSYADAVAIVGAIPRRVVIFARKSLFDIPIVGLMFRLADFVAVERGKRETALASVHRAVELIRAGSSFLVYPEGTRSPDGRLRRFKKGAFVMAIEAGVPIVPIACAGAHRILRKYSAVIRPGKVTVKFGRPIYPAGWTVGRRNALAELVHDTIAAELPEDQRPAGDRAGRTS